MAYNPNFTGAVALGSARQTQTGYSNGSGGTMSIGTAVSVNSSGNMFLLDVSTESLVEGWVGLTSQSVAPSTVGLVVSDGRLQGIPLGLGFAVGDPIWVGVAPGSLTNVKPDITAPGWNSGYFVLFVGVVVKNQNDPSQQDIQLCRQIVGQL